jgi:hypothetical protein
MTVNLNVFFKMIPHLQKEVVHLEVGALAVMKTVIYYHE